MRKNYRLAIFVLVLLACFVPNALAQGDWKKTLEEGLKSDYKMTRTSRLEANNVTETGTVFVVQKEGLAADLATDVAVFTSRVQNGEVSQRGGAAGFFSKSTTKRMGQGERVYVTDIDIKDDRIRVGMLTTETSQVQVKGNTKQTRYKGFVDFEFDKVTLMAMDLDTARKTIEAILLPQDKVAASQTKTLELGQTPEQVEAVMGKPDTIINLGAKVTYVYKNMRVVFTDGKVADVQ